MSWPWSFLSRNKTTQREWPLSWIPDANTNSNTQNSLAAIAQGTRLGDSWSGYKLARCWACAGDTGHQPGLLFHSSLWNVSGSRRRLWSAGQPHRWGCMDSTCRLPTWEEIKENILSTCAENIVHDMKCCYWSKISYLGMWEVPAQRLARNSIPLLKSTLSLYALALIHFD